MNVEEFNRLKKNGSSDDKARFFAGARRMAVPLSTRNPIDSPDGIFWFIPDYNDDWLVFPAFDCNLVAAGACFDNAGAKDASWELVKPGRWRLVRTGGEERWECVTYGKIGRVPSYRAVAKERRVLRGRRRTVLRVAKLVAAIVEGLEMDSQVRAELARRYDRYLNFARSVAELEKGNRAKGGQGLVSLDELARGFTEKTFVQLLDAANDVGQPLLRKQLMELLLVDEILPAVGLPVDSTNREEFEVVATEGNGRDARISRIESPGYRLRQSGNVLKKPHVRLELVPTQPTESTG